MRRIFLDGNVIFTAAHNPAGKSALIFELARKGYWDLITSQYAWEEARRNISIKFPGCLPEIDKLPKLPTILDSPAVVSFLNPWHPPLPTDRLGF